MVFATPDNTSEIIEFLKTGKISQEMPVNQKQAFDKLPIRKEDKLELIQTYEELQANYQMCLNKYWGQ